ncbi:MAG: hypothetical protein ACI8S6_005620, partial [Myxococcota bacterium]
MRSALGKLDVMVAAGVQLGAERPGGDIARDAPAQLPGVAEHDALLAAVEPLRGGQTDAVLRSTARAQLDAGAEAKDRLGIAAERAEHRETIDERQPGAAVPGQAGDL